MKLYKGKKMVNVDPAQKEAMEATGWAPKGAKPKKEAPKEVKEAPKEVKEVPKDAPVSKEEVKVEPKPAPVAKKRKKK